MRTQPIKETNKISKLYRSIHELPLRIFIACLVANDYKKLIIEGEVSEDELYEAFEENEYCKIFDVTDFAYRQITVERPLRMKFVVTDEKIASMQKASFFEKLSSDDRSNVLMCLQSMKKGREYNALIEFEDSFIKCSSGTFFNKGTRKKVLDVFGERDEAADICKDKDGNPEPDSELRDYENVPWGQDIEAYFEKEVKPFVSDAWIDKTVVDSKDGRLGKVGYEIPFTRYFYKYQAPRDLNVIEAEIESTEKELAKLLKEI